MPENTPPSNYQCASCLQDSVVPHYLQYDETRSACPICEGCHNVLATPEARWPFYAAHIADDQLTMEQSKLIADAVAAGK